jgi:tetratricopeptide (TPR) repeat protein
VAAQPVHPGGRALRSRARRCSPGRLARRAGQRLGNLGSVDAERGSRAERCQRLALASTHGSATSAASRPRHINLGILNLHLGRFDQFAAHEDAAVAKFRQMGSRAGEALALTNLGEAYLALGRLRSACEVLTTALEFHRETDSRRLEADTLRCLAETHRDAGRLADALACAEAAVVVAEETRQQRIEGDVRSTLGSVHFAAGAYDAVIEQHRQSIDLIMREHDQQNATAEVA